VNFIRKGDALLRRVTEIDELMTFETRNDQILYNTVFSYDPNSDSFRMSHDSQLMEKFARFRGVAQSEAWLELEKRASILERLKGRRLKYGDFWSEIRNALNLESGRENV
ncbi:MAG TPA: hypothetical protein VKU79_03540, partial [Thermoplasmataceae archaeon]|nr:hypothetical protein [Thermoplasmataceae archaeon]